MRFVQELWSAAWRQVCQQVDRQACALPLRVEAEGGERVKHRAEWCRSCQEYRIYDVLPGHPESKLCGSIPDMAFCVHCGWWMDVDIEESA